VRLRSVLTAGPTRFRDIVRDFRRNLDRLDHLREPICDGFSTDVAVVAFATEIDLRKLASAGGEISGVIFRPLNR
jgi:hypothetical protein